MLLTSALVLKRASTLPRQSFRPTDKLHKNSVSIFLDFFQLLQ
jgi:hypothetical protein